MKAINLNSLSCYFLLFLDSFDKWPQPGTLLRLIHFTFHSDLSRVPNGADGGWNRLNDRRHGNEVCTA